MKWISALGMLLSVLLAGCAHTILPDVSIKPTEVGTARLPLTIAVEDDPEVTYHRTLGFYEKMNPAMADAVRDAFRQDFEKVVLVGKDEPVDNADLLAVPQIDASQWQRLKLSVAFEQPRTGDKIAEFSSVKPLKFNADGTRKHLWSDLGMMSAALIIPFGVGVAAMEPYLQRHDAERFNAGFGPALVEMATDIAAKAAKDPAIATFQPRHPKTASNDTRKS